MHRTYIFAFCFLMILSVSHTQENTITITRIATNLLNPRGVAVMPDGRLLVAEVGTGYVSGNPADNTGRLSIFEDVNQDGDYDDAGERTPLLEQLPGYNILYQFQPGRDEIVGIGDVLVLDNGFIYFTLDDNFEVLSIVELTPEFERTGNLYVSNGSLNSIAYDPITEQIFVAESSRNAVSTVLLNGMSETLTTFNMLEHQQQAVPSGIAFDPTTGDLLVTLFSGQLWDYHGEVLSFMPGDSKVVRINPRTGESVDEITGLTTAVDVAVDDAGNLYVVELTVEWAMPTMDTNFDVYAPDAPPDAGGYARYTGRVTMYPVGGDPVILADGLDQPTNITYHDHKLYISVGQGTPNRPIWVHGGLTHIIGEIYMIEGI